MYLFLRFFITLGLWLSQFFCIYLWFILKGNNKFNSVGQNKVKFALKFSAFKIFLYNVYRLYIVHVNAEAKILELPMWHITSFYRGNIQ